MKDITDVDQTAFDDVDLINEQLTEAVHELQRKRRRVLALALKAGYDGVDILPQQNNNMADKIRLGFEWEGWNQEPPERGRFERVVRYDFRELAGWEKKELLARYGLEGEAES